MYCLNSATRVASGHIGCYFLFILVHQKWGFRSWYILLLPGWMDSFERCASSMIWFFSSRFFGTTNRCWNQSYPLSSTQNWVLGSSLIFSLIWKIPLSIFCLSMTWLSSEQLSCMWHRLRDASGWTHPRTKAVPPDSVVYGLKHPPRCLLCLGGSGLCDQSLIKSSHLRCLIFNSDWVKMYLRLLWSV
jgi:hypothetical protein